MDDIAARVVKIVVDHMVVYGDKVTPKASVRVDLGSDNLDIVELAMMFEDEFGITIPDRRVKQITTVQDAIRNAENARKSA